MLSWGILNILAWTFGLKAVYDLRGEFEPQAKTWVFLTWAVWPCLLMELAMVGGPYVAGLGLFSTLTGVTSGVFLWLAFSSLRVDIQADRREQLRSPYWDRWLAAGYVVCGLGAVAVARTSPVFERLLIERMHFVDGAVWLTISGWLLITTSVQPVSRDQAGVVMPRALPVAFGFALAHAALRPLAWLTGWHIEPTIGHLLGTLFILTLVTTLYAMVLHVRSVKLSAAMRDLHSAQEQLWSVERIATVGTLAAGAAHDFNNTLTAIMGYADLALEHETVSPEVRADLRAIQQSATVAATLTSNLLGVARRQVAHHVDGDLAETVRAPLVSLARDFAKHNIVLVTNLEPELCADVDGSLLFQVMLNLYLNARDAMIPKGGGTLEVVMQNLNQAVEITVTDTGVGVPDAFRSRIFQPLQTTKGTRGTGLGLSVSKAIVESMGGSLRFESRQGQGTTFYIMLPRDTSKALTGSSDLHHRRERAFQR